MDALQEMQAVMKEIAEQIQSGDFSLTDESYQELIRDCLALTVVDIVNGAAYLFEKESPTNQRNWKTELELEQYCHVLEPDAEKGGAD